MNALVWLAIAYAAPKPQVGVVASPLDIDGALTEPAWQTAEPIRDFLQYQPVEGGAPPGATEVRFLQDQRFFYVGVRVSGVDYDVRARISARELINADDQVGIYLDTFHDGRSGYIFYFNPLGVQQDIRHNAGSWNPNWDTAYRSKGRVTQDGYEIEIAFPWRSLKFPPVKEGETQTWGLIVTRKVPHLGAKFAYPDITRNRPLLFSEEADLDGVRPPTRGSGLELIPSLTATQIWLPEEDPRPFEQLDVDPWYEAFRPSLDVRWGITPDLGLAGTINPDFSQVESDLADVRLNARFAFRFTERRPFFLDGIDLFQDDVGTLYSRSVNQPLYGLKLSGREGPLSIGLLHALDQSPLPSVHEKGAEGFAPEDVENRWASNTLARLRLDAFRGGWVGVTATDKRILASPTRTGGAGAHNNLGADFGVPIGARWIAGGSSQASLLSPPETDPRFGFLQSAFIRRNSGIGTGFGVDAEYRSEDFRQEMGFLNQTGNVQANAFVDHTFEGKGLISTFTPAVWTNIFQEFDGDHYRSLGTSQNLLVNGIQSFGVEARVDQRRQDEVVVDGWSVRARWSGQIGALFELSPSASYTRSLDFGTLGPAGTWNAGGRVTFRTAGFRLDTDVSWSHHMPEGLAPEIGHRVRATAFWQWTRSLGARLLVQESGRDETEGLQQELLISPLITWLEVPGTAAFLGWTERIDLLKGSTVERAIFAKVSVLLRP